MRIGVPKEIKNHEYRVGLTPAAVRELKSDGHQILIESRAGAEIGLSDADYQAAGAEIAAKAREVFDRADLIIKVKEPQPDECRMLRAGQILFTYLHLAPDPEQAKLLLQSGATAIAYETVTDARGRLPLLTPMSEVAGRMSLQAAATALEKIHGGSGVLLSGVPGVAPGKVVILGGGVVGTNAAIIAMGMGAQVTILDKSLARLGELDALYAGRLTTLYATTESIEASVLAADVVIGAVLVPGAAAPKLVTRDMVSRMKRGSVIVDVAIDQGGSVETAHPTTHADPLYVVDGVLHYCVTNMPGAVARTSTYALGNATLPYIRQLAGKGLAPALLADAGFRAGLNVHQGRLTHPAVAAALGQAFTTPEQALAA